MAPTIPMPSTLSVSQAAIALNSSEDHIRRLIADGILPAFRISPRKTLIKREDLEGLLFAHRV